MGFQQLDGRHPLAPRHVCWWEDLRDDAGCPADGSPGFGLCAQNPGSVAREAGPPAGNSRPVGMTQAWRPVCPGAQAPPVGPRSLGATLPVAAQTGTSYGGMG